MIRQRSKRFTHVGHSSNFENSKDFIGFTEREGQLAAASIAPYP